MMADLIGKKLGKWTVERELGRGGMGKVFLAHDDPPAGPDAEATVMQAAVKVLAPELAQDPGFLERFQCEIEVLRQLQHPHIVRLYDSGQQDGLYYYVMEYLPGQNFEDLLKERGRLPWKEVLDVALQICPALKHAHDHGVIHRDIKPQNLLCTDTGLVKLTDFGIAKVFAGKQLTVTGGLVGTAEYLSPEQAAGKRVTHRSDLYSFGVVLYTLLTGRPPFQGRSTLDLLHKHRFAQFDPPQRFVPDVPSDFNKIVCDLLEKDPAKRPANALVLLRQLESFREKIRRREQLTVVSGEASPADGGDGEEAVSGRDLPGPATLMSQLIREELAAQRQVGPVARLVNHPLVLVSLLAACLGVIVWAVWFKPKGDAGDAVGQQMSEPERLYSQARRLARAGDAEGAYHRYRNLETAFNGVPSADGWVKKARESRAGLEKEFPDLEKRWEERWKDVQQSLRQAQALAREGKRGEAEAIWDALEALYWSDPDAVSILRQIRHDREASVPKP